MKTAIITTTINVPLLLADYAADAAAYGHRHVEFFVVGDRKTPPETEAFCHKVAAHSGLPVRWLGIHEQEKIMADFPELAAHMPWNSIQRRNIGHLQAWIEGFDILVAIDDDNFRVDPDYVGLNQIALQATDSEMVEAEDSWFNCCTLLDEAQGRSFFPRGYPLSQRRDKPRAIKYSSGNMRVVVNAGLWLGDPDVDAVTRLAAPVNAVACRREHSLALAPGTWCPFNSQNTAIHRDILPAWFMSPFVGRFDDIWASYIVLACAQKLGHTIAFGRPLVRQNRNAHNLWHDLDLERKGMQFTEPFCAALRGADFSGRDYMTCAAQAIDAIESWVVHGELDRDVRASCEAFIRGYRLWISAFQRLAMHASEKLSA